MTDSTTPTLPDPLQRYIDAWNRHDAHGIVATFTEGGTYSDPQTRGPVSGGAIGAYAAGLWQAFPDLRFDVSGMVADRGTTVYMPWIMSGTNTGSLGGLPPTGQPVQVHGVDIVTISEGGIQSVIGYFDSRAVPEQLGLQVHVMPGALGPFTFGTSTHVTSGSASAPHAFSVTSLVSRSPAESEVIRNLARDTLKDMLGMDGFIAATTVTCGGRHMTFSAWEKAEDIHQLRSSAAHNEASRKFFGPELASGGLLSVWDVTPEVRTFQRCAACHRMVNLKRGHGKCGCGASVEAARMW